MTEEDQENEPLDEDGPFFIDILMPDDIKNNFSNELSIDKNKQVINK